MTTEAAAIEARKLTKRFGDVLAVDAVDFDVRPGVARHPGEVLGFLGSNGAGKTTTINMLTGPTQRRHNLLVWSRRGAVCEEGAAPDGHCAGRKQDLPQGEWCGNVSFCGPLRRREQPLLLVESHGFRAKFRPRSNLADRECFR